MNFISAVVVLDLSPVKRLLWPELYYKKGISWHVSYLILGKNRDSSVGIALGYKLDDRSSRVRLPVGAGNFSLHHRVQNGSGAHPTSYPMGTRGSFPGGKEAGA
jgi:hypothetical protein